MKTVCEINKCSGCMACVDICAKGAIKIDDSLEAYNAVIQEDKCINCNACIRVCQKNNTPQAVAPIKWYQGWADEAELRENGASGGFASAISKSFIEGGGYVASCTFKDGSFRFQIENTLEGIKKFAGSKYVKSDPSGIYSDISKLLKQGEKVLFVGLPCQVAAIKNYIGKSLQDELYTIDLICHGTPSPKLLETYLKQYGYSLEKIQNIQFRVKGNFQAYNDYKSVVTSGVCDKYHIAFLNAISYTENCYECDYAEKERVSDLTLGDSWGSELGMAELKNGISLSLCQSEKGIELLKNAKLQLKAVDIENAVLNNQQLNHPAEMPKSRNKFFHKLRNGHNFNSLIFKCFPKQCVRQEVKRGLILMNIVKGKLDYGIRVLELGEQ